MTIGHKFVTAVADLAKAAAAPLPPTVVVDGVLLVRQGDGQFKDLRKPEPLPDTLQVATLQALVDYVAKNPDHVELAKHALHVGVNTVSLLSPTSGRWHQREVHARAKCAPLELRLNVFMPHEEAMIALQAFCQPTDELTALLALLGTIQDSNVKTAVDDGVTQVVTRMSGAAVGPAGARAGVQPIHTLRPWCTFREVAQPERRFLLRLKPNSSPDGLPAVAFWAADGDAWELQAVSSVAAWLRAALAGLGADMAVPFVMA